MHLHWNLDPKSTVVWEVADEIEDTYLIQWYNCGTIVEDLIGVARSAPLVLLPWHLNYIVNTRLKVKTYKRNKKRTSLELGMQRCLCTTILLLTKLYLWPIKYRIVFISVFYIWDFSFWSIELYFIFNVFISLVNITNLAIKQRKWGGKKIEMTQFYYT